MKPFEPVTWSQVREDLEAAHSPPFGQRATWLKYRRVIDLLERHAATPAEVGPRTIAAVIGEFQTLGRRLTTIRSNLKVARAVCNYLVTLGQISASPFRLAKLTVRVPRGYTLKRAFAPADIARVLDQADREFLAAKDDETRFRAGRIRALTYLVAYTGIRAREALYMRCRDVDTVRRVVRITGADRPTKTLASIGEVPIPIEAAQVLEEWKREQLARGRSFLISCQTVDRPWDSSGAKYRPTPQLNLLAWRAGVRGMTLLALRHSYTTNVRRFFGLNTEETQSLLRHASPETQENYLHDDVDHLVRRVEGISFRQFAQVPTGPASGNEPNIR